METKFFFYLADLFNEGQTVAALSDVDTIREAARLVFPGSFVGAGAIDTKTNTQILYIETLK